ncbi:MAG: hypothetical protein LH615_12100 [Ferruginibacter sp.]|nr:hypothetical protein [Ferruginibacter sp.]
MAGAALLQGKFFDKIGFNAIEDDLFIPLIITGLVWPVSKLKTVDHRTNINTYNSVFTVFTGIWISRGYIKKST